MHYLDFVWRRNSDVEWKHSYVWTDVSSEDYYQISRGIKALPHSMQEVGRSNIFGRHRVYSFRDHLKGVALVPSRALDKADISTIGVGSFERIDLSILVYEIGVRYDPTKVFSLNSSHNNLYKILSR